MSQKLSLQIKGSEIEQKEQAIRDTAFGLSNQLETLREISPVAAGNLFKQVLQYLNEKNTTKTMFTLKELEELGFINN